MTVVMAIQALVLALAGLLLLETWARRSETERESLGKNANAVNFHPELIVRWDDEANYARHARCTRSSAECARRELRPALTPLPRSHTRIR